MPFLSGAPSMLVPVARGALSRNSAQSRKDLLLVARWRRSSLSLGQISNDLQLVSRRRPAHAASRPPQTDVRCWHGRRAGPAPRGLLPPPPPWRHPPTPSWSSSPLLAGARGRAWTGRRRRDRHVTMPCRVGVPTNLLLLVCWCCCSCSRCYPSHRRPPCLAARASRRWSWRSACWRCWSPRAPLCRIGRCARARWGQSLWWSRTVARSPTRTPSSMRARSATAAALRTTTSPATAARRPPWGRSRVTSRPSMECRPARS